MCLNSFLSPFFGTIIPPSVRKQLLLKYSNFFSVFLIDDLYDCDSRNFITRLLMCLNSKRETQFIKPIKTEFIKLYQVTQD